MSGSDLKSRFGEFSRPGNKMESISERSPTWLQAGHASDPPQSQRIVSTALARHRSSAGGSERSGGGLSTTPGLPKTAWRPEHRHDDRTNATASRRSGGVRAGTGAVLPNNQDSSAALRRSGALRSELGAAQQRSSWQRRPSCPHQNQSRKK